MQLHIFDHIADIKLFVAFGISINIATLIVLGHMSIIIVHNLECRDKEQASSVLKLKSKLR